MIGLAMVLALAATDAWDPLAPAATGKVLCISPDAARKTCAAIGAFTRLADGAIDNRSVVLLGKSPLMVMETHSQLSLKPGGAVCGPITRHDLDIASFKINGAPASEAQTERLRARLIQQMTPLFGHEACVIYRPAGDHLAAQTTDNGEPQGPPATVIWVSEADYQVAP